MCKYQCDPLLTLLLPNHPPSFSVTLDLNWPSQAPQKRIPSPFKTPTALPLFYFETLFFFLPFFSLSSLCFTNIECIFKFVTFLIYYHFLSIVTTTLPPFFLTTLVMPTPPFHSSSHLDTLPLHSQVPSFQTATCSAPVPTSTTSDDTAYPTLSDTCYSSKDDSDQHSHMTPDISTMPFLPELLLSSLLQTQVRKE